MQTYVFMYVCLYACIMYVCTYVRMYVLVLCDNRTNRDNQI